MINEGHKPAFVIGFAGELREKKGLRPLLSAYTQVNKKVPVTLLIVGDIRAGEDQQIFQKFKQSYPGIQTIVTGYVSPGDLPAYYSLMDVFVQPSLCDGLPNALLEAMPCEKAWVGGIMDAVIDCEDGRLVSTNDVDELANTIIELLANEPLRKNFGHAAHQTIMHRFTLQGELDETLAV